MALFSSSVITLIYSDETRVVRCDFNVRIRQVVLLRTWPRARDYELPELVEQALLQDSKRLGKVYILASEAWSQKVSVAGSTVEGLTPAETARALAFEAESFSGIAAFDSVVSYVSLGKQDGLHTYWVTQIAQATRSRIEKIVQQRGGQCGGILHPAGLPVSLADSKANWNRLEQWPGLSLGVNALNGIITYRVINPERRGQVAETTVWQEALAATNATLPLATTTHRLQSNEELGVWLGQWGKAFSQGIVGTPIIKSEPKPLGKEVYIAIACVLGGLALGLVAMDRHSVQAKIAQDSAETARLNAATDLHTKLSKERETLQKKIQTLTATNVQLSQSVAVMETSLTAQHQRWRQLLGILAEQTSEHMVIQEISVNAGIIEIRGKCIGTNAAHNFATQVATQIRPLGWELIPAQKAVATTELYDFTWHLTEVAIPTTTTESILAESESNTKEPIYTSSDTNNFRGVAP